MTVLLLECITVVLFESITMFLKTLVCSFSNALLCSYSNVLLCSCSHALLHSRIKALLCSCDCTCAVFILQLLYSYSAMLLPAKETSVSLSMLSSRISSLSLELPRDLFILRKYCPHRCRPASFFSLFSFALLFWNHTCSYINSYVSSKRHICGNTVSSQIDSLCLRNTTAS